MNGQKNPVLLVGKIIVVLLTVSLLYTIAIFLISSGPQAPWQSQEIHPTAPFNLIAPVPAINCPDEKTLSWATKNPDKETVVGPFREGNYSVSLIDYSDGIVESVYGYGTVSKHPLTPVCMNTTTVGEKFPGIPATTAGVTWYRYSLYMPENNSVQRLPAIDILDAWVEREWDTGMNRSVIHTEGRFYGIYGQGILEVVDHSYSASSPFFDQYGDCAKTAAGEVVGSLSRDTTLSLRNIPFQVKYSTSSWISIDRYYTAEFGISSDKWISVSLPTRLSRECPAGNA